MKIADPYKCDVCSVTKQPSNGWLLGVVRSLPILIADKPVYPEMIIVTTWNNELAEEKEVAHLCGATCSQKWSASELQKLQEKKSHVEGGIGSTKH